MASRAPTREWLGRAALILAALACLATQQGPSWWLSAAAPGATTVSSSWQLVRVESSERAFLTYTDAAGVPSQGTEFPRLPDSADWPGRADYLAPPGAYAIEVGEGGDCSAGGCLGRCSMGHGSCSPPPRAFVRIVSLAPVAVWTAEATSAAHLVRRNTGALEVRPDGSLKWVSVRVSVEGMGDAFLAIVPVGDLDATSFPPPTIAQRLIGGRTATHAASTVFTVEWVGRAVEAGADLQTLQTHYRFVAKIVGPCSGSACLPPPGAEPRIVSIGPS